MSNRGIPREPSKPRDAVETTRAASAPDWSNLQQDYEATGSIRAIAERYGVGFKKVRNELARQGISIKPRGHVKGQKKSQAWRDASRKHWDDPVWREEQRRKWLERAPSMRGWAANSPLEKKLHTALIKAGISFSTQRKHLGRYLVDIEIEQAPVIIEADGTLHVRNADRDAQRDREITETGYRVFRFTGTQINAGPDACIQQVIAACGLIPEAEPRADIRNGGRGEDSPSWTGGKQDYTCEQCQGTFQAWKSTRKKAGRSDHVFCTNECQRLWQIANPPRQWTDDDRTTHSSRMRELWADPVWRAETLARREEARRQKQMKI
jgi:very-short-patch-repair endonuclease